MNDTENKGKKEQITYFLPGKWVEISSDNSSPESENPPAKSVKFVKSNMVELEEIWKVLNNIKENTNKLLEEDEVIREQYNELQKSLEFHVNKMEELVAENKDLKREVKSLKETLNESGFLVSKETVVLRQWGRSKQKFGFIKRVDKCWITTVKDLESWRFER